MKATLEANNTSPTHHTSVDDFVSENGEKIKMGFRGEVYTKEGFHIGNLQNARGYPWRVKSCDGKWTASFGSKVEALRELYERATKTNLVMPDVHAQKYYILRISQLVLQISPDPKAKPLIRCRLYYNSKNTTGNSAASKPAKSTTAVIVHNERKIIPNKLPDDFEKFENLDEIMDVVEERLTEALESLK